MIKISKKENCCGCSACYNICNKNAIEMKSDNEGFLYPKINTELCNNCEVCKKVCPIINRTPKKAKIQKAFIAQNKNKVILRESTSGGAFTAIAEYVIESGGVVFGAAFNDDFKVIHTYVEKKMDLAKFRNSKYVQSEIGNTYKQTRDFLRKGRMVCFSGTPCQIEGLKSFLMRDYNNLITVDVVCRAVPSPGVWEKYFSWINQLDKIESIRFRDKTLGYQFSTMEIKTNSNKTYRSGIESQKWLRMFFSGMIIRPSCSVCKFRDPNRVSDITIWDCFNIYKIDKSFNEDVGTTRIVVHTDKGFNTLKKIKDRLLIKEIDYYVAIQDVKEMISSPDLHKKRTMFFKDFEKHSMEQLIKKYFPDTIKIAIKSKLRFLLNKCGLDKTVKHILNKG